MSIIPNNKFYSRQQGSGHNNVFNFTKLIKCDSKIFMRYWLCLVLLLAIIEPSPPLYAQKPTVPSPGQPQSKPLLLTGGTAHIGNGTVIPVSVIRIENGKITMVADMTTIRINPEGATVLDISGKHVYPGLIATNTSIGLIEIGAVRATNDRGEVGDLNPDVRALIGYNTDSHVIPTVRSNGILLAQIVPAGGFLSGLSSVVQLDAWNWEDAAYQKDNGLYMTWPATMQYNWEEGRLKPNEKYSEQYQSLLQLFSEAKAYCSETTHMPQNLKLEAMCGLFNKTAKLYVQANSTKEISEAVNFAKQYGVAPVIVGGYDAWQVSDLLKENNVPVVLQRTHQLPHREDEDVYLPSRLPKMLKDAGVLFAITVGDGWDGFWDQRNLPFEAGTAACFGLSKEEALQAITLSPAKIMGIADKTGSIETGKDANLIVSKGDVLDMAGNYIEQAFIQGRMVDLDNKQKALYRKFMQKYQLTPKQE